MVKWEERGERKGRARRRGEKHTTRGSCPP